MRELPVPQEAEKREKILRAYQRKCATYSAFFYIFLALLVAGFLGAIISVIVFEFSDSMSDRLCYLLLGVFFGCGAAAGGFTYLFSRLLSAADLARLDFSERCSSEYSFYVGEGTLATFEESSLLLHGDKGDTKNIRIPYAEVRFISVCTRRSPKEKGEWSVVLELPTRYLSKDGKGEAGDTVLIQTDAKERLYRTISERGLKLEGEDHSPQKNRRYTLKTKFFVPISERRRKSLLMAIFGAVVAAAGIPTAIFWNVTVGSFLSVIGVFLAGRSFVSFLGAKSVFSIYEEGVFWKDAHGERIFLKWEEVEAVTRETVKGTPVLKLQCIYGAYHIPDIAGAYESLKDFCPEKCR